MTAKQNSIHAVINKLTKSGEDAKWSKLTKEQIEYIKEVYVPYDKNYGGLALANKFNINRVTISNVIHSKSWKDYSENYELIPNDVDKTHINKIHIHKCKICNKNFETIYSNRFLCSLECAHKYKRKVERPSKEELLELIKITSFVQIGKMYNVSDNSVRKWCKSYNLPYRKKDIKMMVS